MFTCHFQPNTECPHKVELEIERRINQELRSRLADTERQVNNLEKQNKELLSQNVSNAQEMPLVPNQPAPCKEEESPGKSQIKVELGVMDPAHEILQKYQQVQSENEQGQTEMYDIEAVEVEVDVHVQETEEDQDQGSDYCEEEDRQESDYSKEEDEHESVLSDDGSQESDYGESQCEPPLKIKNCFVFLENLKVNNDQMEVHPTSPLANRNKRDQSVLEISDSDSDLEIIEEKKLRTDNVEGMLIQEVRSQRLRGRTEKKFDFNHVRIWSKFFSFSRKTNLIEAFNPYKATNEEVVSFVHYLKLTERMDKAYLEDIVGAMDKYHTRREDHLFKTAENLNLMLQTYLPSFIMSHPEKFTPLLSCPEKARKRTCVWKDFFEHCTTSNIDPFKVSPEQISSYIQNLFNIEHPDKRQTIFPYCRGYENTVNFVLEGLMEFLEVTKMSSVNILSTAPISSLLKAAKTCDEKLETNELAMSLLPSHNYIRWQTMTDWKKSYWNSKLIRNALTDVGKSLISIEIVATEIGVTPEMVYAAVQKSVKNTDLEPSLNEYLELTRLRTPEMFWAKLWVTELLHKVKNREETSVKVAAQFGVSRREIEKRCGEVRSKEEVDEEKEHELNKRAETKGETDRNRMKTTEVDKQIAMAEKNLDALCEYELKRLENLRERRAMMEQFGILEDRAEIKKSEQVKKRQFKEKAPVTLREKSTRVERLKEWTRCDLEKKVPTDPSFNTIRLTPPWFGNMFKKDDSPTPSKFIVPKVELEASQLLEVTKDYRSSRIFLDSVGMECQLLDSTEYSTDSLDWSKFSTTEEFIVSSSCVTALDSLGDFITFGTEAGGVGVLLGGRSVTIRPHSDTVTDVVTSGARVMSSSMDGSVRTWDLVTQKSSLEYCWDPNMVDISETRQGVCGMLPWGEHVYLLDCNNRVVSLDIRSKNSNPLLDVPLFYDAENREIETLIGATREKRIVEFQNTLTIDIEPGSRKQFLISREDSVKIYDFRNTGTPVSEFPGNLAAWNPDGSCLYVSHNNEYQVFDVTSGLHNCVPGNPKFSHSIFTNKEVLPTLRGNPWCSWQKDTLFHITKDASASFMKRFSSRDALKGQTFLSALDSQSKVLTGFDVETKDSGNFVVHCHRNQPQVVLANTQGDGRLKLVSHSVES